MSQKAHIISYPPMPNSHPIEIARKTNLISATSLNTIIEHHLLYSAKTSVAALAVSKL